jgi:hypothetical protein
MVTRHILAKLSSNVFGSDEGPCSYAVNENINERSVEPIASFAYERYHPPMGRDLVLNVILVNRLGCGADLWLSNEYFMFRNKPFFFFSFVLHHSDSRCPGAFFGVQKNNVGFAGGIMFTTEALPAVMTTVFRTVLR